MESRHVLVSGFALLLGACASWHAPVTVVMPPEPTGSDAAWATLDLDRDGTLERRELDARRAVALLQDLPAADSDGDGAVSRAEWDRWWPRMTRTAPSPSMQRLNPVVVDEIPAAPPPG